MKKERNLIIGNRIRLIRNSRNLTQDNIAKAIGVSLRVWNDAENGRQSVTIDLLLKLKDQFHVNIDYILTGEISSDVDNPLIFQYNMCPVDKREKLIDILRLLVDFSIQCQR